jgi:hypothetical protein
MIQPRQTVAWLILTLMVLLMGFPHPSTAVDQQALIRELMKVSGFEQQIKQIPQQALTSLERDGRDLPPAQYQALRRTLREAFSATTIARQVSKKLRSELDPLLEKELLDWLRSDLGKKIAKLEESARDPQAMKDMQAYATQIKEAPPPPERLALARQIDLASHATEINLDILEATSFSVAISVDATLPGQQRQGEERLRLLMDRQRPKWRDDYQSLMVVSRLYTYQTLSDEELERYVEFLEGDTAQEYYSMAGLALKDALYLAMEQVTRAVSDMLKPPDRRKVA